jgi:hypothetical protein
MKQVHLLIAVATLPFLIPASPMRAAPPTVTPSPGYDARLQEERAAQSGIREQIVTTSRLKSRHHFKRRHYHVHR